MKKSNKPLIISLIVVDLIVTVALLVIHIIMLTQTIGAKPNEYSSIGFIAFLQKNTTVYFWAFVAPLFAILVANIIGLVLYVKKTTRKEPVKVNDLSDEQKEALRQELLRELQGGSSEPKQEETNSEN